MPEPTKTIHTDKWFIEYVSTRTWGKQHARIKTETDAGV
jgi:hypothetical protein